MARRDIFLRIAAGVIGVVAVAMAAATVESPLETTGSGDGSGDTGGGDGAGQPVDAPDVGAPPELGSPPPFLRVFVTLVLVGMLLALAWYIYHDHRRVARMLITTAVVIAVILWVVPPLLDMLPTSQPEPPNQSPPGSFDNVSSGDGGGGGENDGDASIPMNLVVALLGVGVLLVVGARAVLRRRWSEPAVTNDEIPDEAATTAVGSAAGRAADRIEEDADAGNEIYRAWLEMTRLLDVDRPETSTPGEFATVAVETGMDRDHVDELTGLFESVRYGRMPATSDREERAVGILRRIENAYADTDSPSADDDSTGSGGNGDPPEFDGDTESPASDGNGERGDSDGNDERWGSDGNGEQGDFDGNDESTSGDRS